MTNNSRKSSIRPDYKPSRSVNKHNALTNWIVTGIGVALSTGGIFGYQAWHKHKPVEEINSSINVNNQSVAHENRIAINDNSAISQKKEAVQEKKQVPEATPKPSPTPKPPPAEEGASKTSFDFYEVLPKMKVGYAPELLIPNVKTTPTPKELTKSSTKEELAKYIKEHKEQSIKPTTSATPIAPVNTISKEELAKSTKERKEQIVKPTPNAAAPVNAIYMLQAGAFSESGKAKRLRDNLAFLGLATNTQVITINGTEWHRVRVGPFNDIQQAVTVKNRLNRQGIPANLSRERRN